MRHTQKRTPPLGLTSEDDVGQASAAVRVQHVGPHVHGVLQAAVAAPQSREGSLGVVEQGGGGVKARPPRRGAHRALQQRELVELDGRWQRKNGKREKVQRISEPSSHWQAMCFHSA